MDFFNDDEYFRDKSARAERKHANSFKMMSKKFKKLQASFKKQVGELGFMILRILILRLRGRLLEKFKMLDLPKFDRIRDLKAHLRSYLIAIKTTKLNKGQKAQFFSLSLEGFASLWYHSLKAIHRKNWDELVKKFIQ